MYVFIAPSKQIGGHEQTNFLPTNHPAQCLNPRQEVHDLLSFVLKLAELHITPGYVVRQRLITTSKHTVVKQTYTFAISLAVLMSSALHLADDVSDAMK